MLSLMPNSDPQPNMLLTLFNLELDALNFIQTRLRPRCALVAEQLFLRK